jgi:hypothetical protein
MGGRVGPTRVAAGAKAAGGAVRELWRAAAVPWGWAWRVARARRAVLTLEGQVRYSMPVPARVVGDAMVRWRRCC